MKITFLTEKCTSWHSSKKADNPTLRSIIIEMTIFQCIGSLSINILLTDPRRIEKTPTLSYYNIPYEILLQSQRIRSCQSAITMSVFLNRRTI